MGLWPDLLWDSGKPQSQTPEETAGEGEDQRARGCAAGCFLQDLITHIRKRLAGPHLCMVRDNTRQTLSLCPPPRGCGLHRRGLCTRLEPAEWGRITTHCRTFAVVHVQGQLVYQCRQDRCVISGSAVSLPQEAKYFLSNDYLGERWLVQGPFWLHRYLA